MVEKMKAVSIDWGYHTMVQQLLFADGEFFIGKFVRKSDGYISWHMHETATGKGINKVGVICYEKEDDNDENAENALKSIIREFERATHVEFATLL